MSSWTQLVRRIWVAVAAGSLLTMPANPLVAQYRLGDGRGLDRNLQRGSGGANPAKLRNPHGIYSDAVVTGNVTGLSSFRGDISTPAPFEFRDRLGSDDLFDFNRRAYRPQGGFNRTLGGLPSRGALQPGGAERGGYNRGQILLRSGTGAALGDVTGEYQPYGPDAQVRRNDRGALQQFRRQQQQFNRERLRIDTAASYSRHVLAMQQDKRGRRLRIETSPLRGLVTAQQGPRPGEGRPLGAAQPSGADEADDPAADGIVGQNLPDAGFERSAAGRRDASEPLTAAEQRRAAMRATTAQYLEPRRLGLTERLGAELSATHRIEPIRPGLTPVDQAVDRALTLAAPTENEAQAADDEERLEGDAPSDPYERLLWRIRQRYAPSEGEDGADGGEGEGGEGESGDEEEAGEGGAADADRAMDRALGKLDYDLPPIRSLAGGTEQRVKETMADAERQMAEGHYLDAARAYERALVLRGGYPPARIGRAHAYLGAGLFTSAADVLHRALHDHPELIAARYEPPVLPGEKRLAALRRKLQGRAEAFEQEITAPLLLAYLAYQQGDDEALNQHLSHLNQRARGDTLTALLRRIWSDAGSPSKNEPQP